METLLQGDDDRPVVLVDGIVRRPVGWWTPWVHDLAAWLASNTHLFR